MRIDPNITITQWKMNSQIAPLSIGLHTWGQRATQDTHKFYEINADIPGRYELKTVLIAKLTLSLL